MRAQDWYYKLRDAVVTITAFYPGLPSCNASGFLFCRQRRVYVISAAHDVLLTTATDPDNPVFAGLYNVNGTGRNQTYGLQLLGVDATADVSVSILQAAKGMPRPGKHPMIELQDTTDSRVGDPVFNMSAPLNRAVQCFVSGTIRDNKWFDPQGHFIVGCLLTDLLVYGASSGSPVLDSNTGRCLGIVSFGLRGAAGFGGGCNSFTMNRILDNIIGRKNVNVVTGNDGSRYLTNLKGYLGRVQWLGVNVFTMSNLFLHTKQLQGFVLTQTDPASPLSRLLHGAPPLRVGDIVLWGQRKTTKGKGKKMIFGDAEGQVPVGNLLWFVNPEKSCCNLVRFGVIRHASSRVEEVETRLDIHYDPQTELVPVFDLLNEDCSANNPNDFKVDTMESFQFNAFSAEEIGSNSAVMQIRLGPNISRPVKQVPLAVHAYSILGTALINFTGIMMDIANLKVPSQETLDVVFYVSIHTAPPEGSEFALFVTAVALMEVTPVSLPGPFFIDNFTVPPLPLKLPDGHTRAIFVVDADSVGGEARAPLNFTVRRVTATATFGTP